jgi:hypothetical protein
VKKLNLLALLLVASGFFLSFFILPNDVPAVIPKEVISSRTESSKTYDLGNGKYALDSTLGSIHYRNNYDDGNEVWKEIDTTIVDGKINKAPYTLSIYGNSVEVKDKKTNSVTTISLDEIGGDKVQLTEPIYKGNTATFENVAQDTDVQVVATNNHVYFKRILKSSLAPSVAVFLIDQKGTGIKVTPQGRDASYSDIQISSTLENGKLTETVETFNVALVYPLEIDPSLDLYIIASLDDVGLYWDGAAWIFQTVDNLVAGYATAAVYKFGAGIRWQNITIPYGSAITAAYFNITAQAALAGTTVNSRLTGNKELSAATWSTIADYQTRRGTIVGGADNTKITTTTVAWDGIAAWTANVTYQSPSIVTIVQEIINQVGWASGNPLALWWDDHEDRSTHGANCYRSVYSYDGGGLGTGRRPLLHIEYTAVTGPTITTLRATGFGENWLLLNGNVTTYGAAVNITQLGFNYGANPYDSTYTTAYTNYTITSYGYYSYIGNLNAQTIYQFRAAAYNGAWGYGGNRWFSTAPTSIASSMGWEEHAPVVNTTQLIYGSNWGFQRFTTNDTAHTLTGIDLWLSRLNYPGDIKIEIQQAGLNGLPFGSPLTSGTIAGAYTGNIYPISSNTTARYTVPLSPEVSLSANTTYCFTIKALSGDYSNYIKAGISSTYAYGTGYQSDTNGQSWTDLNQDYLFSLWGHPCLQVDNARVFNSYKSANDWLIVFYYANLFPPYYPVQDVKQYFAYQLVNQYNTVIAQQSCASWGARPGSIYLSAAASAGLEWGGQYRVRLIDLRDSTIYMEYLLQSTDWLGSSSSWMGTDLTLLDSWCLSIAQQLATYYNTPFTAAIAGRGMVLNPAGGVMFTIGIPLLDSIRPNLFQVVSTSGTTTSGRGPQTMRQAYQPAVMLGPQAWGALASVGGIIGIDGKTVGFAFILLICIALAGWGFNAGHSIAATILASPVLILGMLTGLFDILIGAVLLGIAFVFLVWKLVFSGG